jgi:hypothetical protein
MTGAAYLHFMPHAACSERAGVIPANERGRAEPASSMP